MHTIYKSIIGPCNRSMYANKVHLLYLYYYCIKHGDKNKLEMFLFLFKIESHCIFPFLNLNIK